MPPRSRPSSPSHPQPRQGRCPSVLRRMLSGSSDHLARSSLRIAHDGEFYRRLISREASSAAVPSFRAFDGSSCGVPFEWESRPGTPKHSSCQAAALPPLTPPPSYQSSPMRAGATGKRLFKAGLLGVVLPRLVRRKPQAPSPSMHALPSGPSFSPAGSFGHHGRCRHPGARSPFSPAKDEDDSDAGSRTPCFGMRHGSRRGCHNAVILKNAFHLPWM
ncbi:hypothetical protein Taro_024751 [Colocasia esculenta]|uniref:Uncharacterized protein n=1 Tax=Colocasia esculenta TaxID=4460 RepID=A0A843VA98_COLES|nr:hypothetical protein [Colocasia esculenta]